MATDYNEYFKHYLDLVNSLEPVDALAETKIEFNDLIDGIDEKMGSYSYGDGKWTIKEVIAHVIDTERVFAYRAMSFARGDKTNLAGFNDRDYAENSGANERTVPNLRDEFNSLRNSSIALFKSFDQAMLQRSGEANNIAIDVKSIAYLLAGHCRHHGIILNERYLKINS